MLDRGADIDAKDDAGATALICSVKGGYQSAFAVSLLCEAGADIEAKNDHGETALMIASRIGNHYESHYYRQEMPHYANIVHTLLAHGAKKEGLDQSSLNQNLLTAIQDGQTDCIDTWIEAGAYIEENK